MDVNPEISRLQRGWGRRAGFGVVCLTIFTLLIYSVATRREPLQVAHDAPARPALRVYIWTDYISPNLVEEFERTRGCRIETHTFTNNEELLAMLKDGRARPDVLVPSSHLMARLTELGLVQKLDYKQLPSAAGIDRGFLKKFDLEQYEAVGVPYFVAATGIAFRREAFTNQPASWAMFDSPAAKKRVTLLDDMREAVAAGIFASGHPDPNTSKDEDLDDAAEVLRRWTDKSGATFNGDTYAQKLLAGSLNLSHAYPGDILQLEETSGQIQFALPREGYAITCDYLCIGSTARQPAMAHALIDYLCMAGVCSRNMIWTGYRAPIKAAVDLLPEAIKKSPMFLNLEDPIDARFLLKPLSDETYEKYRKRFSAITKGGEAK